MDALNKHIRELFGRYDGVLSVLASKQAGRDQRRLLVDDYDGWNHLDDRLDDLADEVECGWLSHTGESCPVRLWHSRHELCQHFSDPPTVEEIQSRLRELCHNLLAIPKERRVPVLEFVERLVIRLDETPERSVTVDAEDDREILHLVYSEGPITRERIVTKFRGAQLDENRVGHRLSALKKKIGPLHLTIAKVSHSGYVVKAVSSAPQSRPPDDGLIPPG